ncbi:unnamed protein product [Bemisia tabaci]|uniref:Uncharacterized protein n=1 Tax=Bemisia tabaci TaxID=7038 RepID=A0A9P0A9M4_BEMTA|nr:unnamed protein product [Bemisia tabaci]
MEKEGLKVFLILLVLCIAAETVLGELTNFLGSDFERPLVRRWGGKKQITEDELQVIRNEILKIANPDTDPCCKLNGENIKGDKQFAIVPNTQCKYAFKKLLMYFNATVPDSCRATRSPKCRMNTTTNKTQCMADQHKKSSFANFMKTATGQTTLQFCTTRLTAPAQ